MIMYCEAEVSVFIFLNKFTFFNSMCMCAAAVKLIDFVAPCLAHKVMS